jgi:RNase P subunit RPR2
MIAARLDGAKGAVDDGVACDHELLSAARLLHHRIDLILILHTQLVSEREQREAAAAAAAEQGAREARVSGGATMRRPSCVVCRSVLHPVVSGPV